MVIDMQAARDVVELITGRWRAQAVYTAVKLGLPEHIEAGRTTSSEFAESTGSKEEGIHRLMRLLVAMGVFEGTERTGYRNTTVSASLLDRPESPRDMCLLYGEEFYTAWGHAHKHVLGIFDFSGGRMVVDVGGGNGHLLTAILEATPDAVARWSTANT